MSRARGGGGGGGGQSYIARGQGTVYGRHKGEMEGEMGFGSALARSPPCEIGNRIGYQNYCRKKQETKWHVRWDGR